MIKPLLAFMNDVILLRDADCVCAIDTENFECWIYFDLMPPRMLLQVESASLSEELF